MFPKGIIIAFEGLDCSFKETNYKNFVSRLMRDYPLKQKLVITESFPRYNNESSYFLSKWLDGTYDRELLKNRPLAVDSMYSLDRFDFWQNTSNKFNKKYIDIKNDYCFIFDRYNFSNAIYNPMYGHQGYMPNIEDFNFDKIIYGIPNPDIVVWMRMRDFSVLEKLIKEKAGTDENEKDITFIKQVWDRSEYILKHNYFDHKHDINTTLITVECLDENGNIRSKEDLANEVYREVMRESEKIIEERKNKK